MLLASGCHSDSSSTEQDTSRYVKIGFDWGVITSPMSRSSNNDDFESHIDIENYVIYVDGERDDFVGTFNLNESITVAVSSGSVIEVVSENEAELLELPVSDSYVVRGEYTVTLADEGKVTIPLKNEHFTFVTAEDTPSLLGLTINDTIIEATENWYRHGFVNGESYDIVFQMTNFDFENSSEAKPGYHHHYYSVETDIDFDWDESWEQENTPIIPWCAYDNLVNLECNGYKLITKDHAMPASFTLNMSEDLYSAQSLANSIFDAPYSGRRVRATFYTHHPISGIIREHEWLVGTSFISFLGSRYYDVFGKSPDNEEVMVTFKSEPLDNRPLEIGKIKLESNDCLVGFYRKFGNRVEQCEGHDFELTTGEASSYENLSFYNVLEPGKELYLHDMAEPNIIFGVKDQGQHTLRQVEIHTLGGTVLWRPANQSWEDFISIIDNFQLSTGQSVTINLGFIFDSNAEEDSVIHIEAVEFKSKNEIN